jgi:hypothetical protein
MAFSKGVTSQTDIPLSDAMYFNDITLISAKEQAVQT